MTGKTERRVCVGRSQEQPNASDAMDIVAARTLNSMCCAEGLGDITAHTRIDISSREIRERVHRNANWMVV